MRHFHLFKLALAAVAASALVAAGSSAASTTSAGTTPLDLTSVQTSFVTVPASAMKTGPKVGDRMIFTSALYNRGAQFGRPSGARVGTGEVICTVLSGGMLECIVTAHLPGGELVLTGSNPTRSKHSTYAVTGGSGIYATVRGSTTGTDISATKTIVSGTLSL